MKRSLMLTSLALGAITITTACGGDDKPAASPTAAVQASPTRGAVLVPTSTPSGPRTPAAEPAIAISQPIAGAVLRPPFRVEGLANVFEGVLFVQLLGPDSKVLCERRVQATSGTGTAGTWQTIVAFPPLTEGGAGTIRAFDRSPRDGSEENIVTRAIQLSNEIAPIVILSPKCNAQVQAQGKLDVNGTASVFEASLLVDLRDATGAVLKKEIVTASAGAPDTGTWQTSFDLATIPAGDYEIVAYETSARDGSVQNAFSIPVRITT